MNIKNLIVPVLGMAAVVSFVVVLAAQPERKKPTRSHESWTKEIKEKEKKERDLETDLAWDGTHGECPVPWVRIPRDWNLMDGGDSPLTIIGDLYDKGCPGSCCPRHGKQIGYHLYHIGKKPSYDRPGYINYSVFYPYWHFGRDFTCKGACVIDAEKRKEALERKLEEKRKKEEEKKWRDAGHYDFCHPPSCTCGK